MKGVKEKVSLSNLSLPSEFVSPVNGDSRDDLGGDSELTADGAPPVVTGRELVPLAPAAIQLSVRNIYTTFFRNRTIVGHKPFLYFHMQADEKKKLLRKFPYFKLTIVIGSGRDLIAMDRGGQFADLLTIYTILYL